MSEEVVVGAGVAADSGKSGVTVEESTAAAGPGLGVAPKVASSDKITSAFRIVQRTEQSVVTAKENHQKALKQLRDFAEGIPTILVEGKYYQVRERSTGFLMVSLKEAPKASGRGPGTGLGRGRPKGSKNKPKAAAVVAEPIATGIEAQLAAAEPAVAVESAQEPGDSNARE